MSTKPKFLRAIGTLLGLALLTAACSGGGGDEVMSRDDAEAKLAKTVDGIDWTKDPVTRRSSVSPAPTAELADSLPPIDQFPLVVTAGAADDVAVEIFVSTEKSGDDTDSWMVKVAEAFNASDQRLSSGARAQVEIRKIASGIGYQYISSGDYLPQAYAPSNVLWVNMADATGVAMTQVSEQLVPNVAGIVLKTETADAIREQFGKIDPSTMIQAVVNGELIMGYTDPFASSTGLNFLVTVLSEFSGGDPARMLDEDVVSTFEEFQRNVPFVALTTLQIRESVEAEAGSLDAFVMEWQTYTKTDSLQSGYEFIPFGVAHDNPLYAVGSLSADETEALDAFATFAGGDKWSELATEFGFNPPSEAPETEVPSGETLLGAQAIWKEKKDGGRPVVAVFVADISGSMSGTREAALRTALLSGVDFITEDTSVGLILFNSEVSEVLPIAPFDLNQKGSFAAAVEDFEVGGGTAMYDAVAVGLKILLDETASTPDAKPILLVLTDGVTESGLRFGDASSMISGLRIPVYTVGFEADVDELSRLSGLVEAASLNANEDDIAYRIGALFNAEL